MRVIVAGGTGVVGAHVVDALRARGHAAVPMARATGVDLVSGAGTADAFAGADAVIDVANVGTMRRAKAEEFFRAVTTNIDAACVQAGVGHYVVLSIVGIDKVPMGYYLGKQLQERLALDAVTPATVVRATQFHEFPGQVLARVPGPVAGVPDLQVQPIAARDVAEHLVELVSGPPQGKAADLAGPKVESLVAMARAVVRARRERRVVVPMPLPVPSLRQAAAGGLLPTTDGPRGTQTFDDWLLEHYGSSEARD